jgi:hypothetical protein
MVVFHETTLVSIAQALMASMLEIHVQCGMPLISLLHERLYKQEFALALTESNVHTLLIGQTVRQLLVVCTRDQEVAFPSTNLHTYIYLRLRVAESLGSLWRVLNEKPTHLEGTERPREWPGIRRTNTGLNLLIT